MGKGKDIKDTKDIRINVYGKEGHAHFIRMPGGKTTVVYGRQKFFATLDNKIGELLKARQDLRR